MSRKWIAPIAVLSLLLVLLACQADGDDRGARRRSGPVQVSAPTPVAPSPVPIATRVPTPVPVPSPTPAPRVLTVCVGSEPDTLYLYRAATFAARLIWQAVYDGPIDARGPTILAGLPSLDGGDARLEPVTVAEGDRVVDDAGRVVALAKGTRVRAAGCRVPGCAAVYDGQPLAMDQLSATFRLADGVVWSDGAPLTAADSTFSFEAARQAGRGGALPGGLGEVISRTAGYTALDERTVRWVGVPGFLDRNYQANFFSPLPRHRLAGLSPDEWLYADDSARLPLGWGPYVLTDWLPGEQIVAERNPRYFRAAEGLPYFDRLMFRFIGSDPEASVEALRDGRCDVLAPDTLVGAGLDRLLELEAAGALRVYAGEATTWEHLDFNVDPAPGSERPAFFRDVRARQAAAYCIDRQRLAAEVMPAYALPGDPIYAGMDLPAYAHDPARGEALLDEAGWRDTDGDGVREAHGVAGIADGTLLAVKLQAPSSGTRSAIVGRVAADLAACGMGVALSLPAPAEFFAAGPEGLLYGRRFDLAEQAWIATPAPGCGLFTSDRIPTAANGWSGPNVAGYANPAFDAACAAALAALPGTAGYAAAQQRPLQIFAEDLPILPLFMRSQWWATRPDLAGVQPGPVEAWDIEDWRLGP